MSIIISQDAIDLIKVSEGLRLHAYPDPASGNQPWTIGYGHTKGVTPGMTITEVQANDYLDQDILFYTVQVLSKLKVTLNPNQLGALVSFAMNVETWERSSVLAYANDPTKWNSVPGRLALYRLASGKVEPGLVVRRQKEGTLWLEPVSDTETPTSVPNAKPDFNMNNVFASLTGLGLTGAAAASDSAKHIIDNLTETIGVNGGVVLLVIAVAFVGLLVYEHWTKSK